MLVGYSAVAYHLAAETGCGFEPGCAANFYSGAEEYVGEDHEVRYYPLLREDGRLGGIKLMEI